MGFSNVDDQDITKDYFRASEELVVLVAFITSGSGSAMMLAATSWFFAFDLYKLKIEEGRCPPESLFWTNHAFSLSLSHQRGQGGSSLALHSIFQKQNTVWVCTKTSELFNWILFNLPNTFFFLWFFIFLNLFTFLNFEEKLAKLTEKFSKSTNKIAGNSLLTNEMRAKTVLTGKNVNNNKARQKS